jgi:hypothetical protein
MSRITGLWRGPPPAVGPSKYGPGGGSLISGRFSGFGNRIGKKLDNLKHKRYF